MRTFLKKNKITLLLVFIILAGLSLIVYPTFSDWWNSFHASRAIASYVEAVEDLSAEEEEAMLEAAHAYNDSMETGTHFLVSEEEYAAYEKLLNISGTGIMGYIQIPKINVDLPIYHGTDESVLQIAVGHIAGSSLPVGGESAHCVLSGHRGLPSARLFTDLDQLAEGDIFMITVLDETVTYQVDQIRIVLPQEVDELAIEEGKDYCTLVTCTPYGVNTHRILVRGSRIENLEGDVVVTSEAMRISRRLVIPLIAIPLVILFLLFLFFGQRGKKPDRSGRELLEEWKKKR